MMKTSVLFSAVCVFRELVWEFLWFYDVLLVCSFSSVCPVKQSKYKLFETYNKKFYREERAKAINR
jgi:hypothetical protein